MSEVAAHEERQLARPLHVLVPLIRADLKQGTEAAKTASEPYWRAAGQKMLEAKAQLDHGKFTAWVLRNFDIGIRHAQQYMALARATADPEMRDAIRFSNFREAVRETTDNPNYGKPASWRAEIVEDLKRAKEEAARHAAEELSRQQEREAERKLAVQLITIGFKALASKLHPDKGGSRDAMQRLNRVRDRLKQHA
jgi:hypothetical protein